MWLFANGRHRRGRWKKNVNGKNKRSEKKSKESKSLTFDYLSSCPYIIHQQGSIFCFVGMSQWFWISWYVCVSLPKTWKEPKLLWAKQASPPWGLEFLRGPSSRVPEIWVTHLLSRVLDELKFGKCWKSQSCIKLFVINCLSDLVIFCASTRIIVWVLAVTACPVIFTIGYKTSNIHCHTIKFCTAIMRRQTIKRKEFGLYVAFHWFIFIQKKVISYSVIFFQ